jgi:hypothetical protein
MIGSLAGLGSGGIVLNPTDSQISSACSWGSAQGNRGFTHAMIAEGYGAMDTQQSHWMVLVVTPLVLSQVYYELNARTWYLGVCLPDLPSSYRRRSAPI